MLRTFWTIKSLEASKPSGIKQLLLFSDGYQCKSTSQRGLTKKSRIETELEWHSIICQVNRVPLTPSVTM